MIPANQLRLGNYALFDNKFCKICEISESSRSSSGFNVRVQMLDELKTNYTFEHRELNPIPLTEERMIAFGFSSEVTQLSIEWQKDKFFLYQNIFIGRLELGVTIYGIDVFVKYIHELQNLYFAITGKELIPNKQNDFTLTLQNKQA